MSDALAYFASWSRRRYADLGRRLEAVEERAEDLAARLAVVPRAVQRCVAAA
jgi:hypothetical protein